MAAFLAGFGIGYFRAARRGRPLPDRLHGGIVMGLALTLASLFIGMIVEALLTV